ncbi:hypothetical protein NL676_037889 [Syzygium grande]|nr:hypothetical protein NL676_037889 [Syzygium grande]
MNGIFGWLIQSLFFLGRKRRREVEDLPPSRPLPNPEEEHANERESQCGGDEEEAEVAQDPAAATGLSLFAGTPKLNGDF